MKRTWAISGLLVVMLVVAQTASSALISVDLGPNQASVKTDRGGGLYTADLKGVGNESDQIGIWENSGIANIWNYRDGNSASGLYDADGNATGVALAVTLSAATASNWGPGDLLSDGFYHEPTFNVEWSITGLTPNQKYALIVYTGIIGATETQVTVNGTGSMAYTGTKYQDYAGGYFKYLEVNANGSGELLGVSNNSSTHTTFVGFQLDVIPEPASLGMLGVAAAAMLLRRRIRG